MPIVVLQSSLNETEVMSEIELAAVTVVVEGAAVKRRRGNVTEMAGSLSAL